MDEREREIDDIAHLFHDRYEALAPEWGYTTRDETAVDWNDLPPPNKGLMRAVVRDALMPLLDKERERYQELERLARDMPDHSDLDAAVFAYNTSQSELRVERERTAREHVEIQGDLRALLDALGMFSGARPQSPQEVMYEATEAVRILRERNARLVEALRRPCDSKECMDHRMDIAGGAEGGPRTRLLEALRTYGRHIGECAEGFTADCTCGYTTALESEKEEK